MSETNQSITISCHCEQESDEAISNSSQTSPPNHQEGHSKSLRANLKHQSISSPLERG
ncbi:MAG: hypothetical protein N2319_08185 [Candidatus Kapabacteria bacterium]|nr:hypothetical protein [Candidatus Kapabacteria bacterium]